MKSETVSVMKTRQNARPTKFEGLFEPHDEGYGFIRTTGYLSDPSDVYVSAVMVHRYGLRWGDLVKGAARPNSTTKRSTLFRVDSVNDQAAKTPRGSFEALTPSFPDAQLRLEIEGEPENLTGRIIDLIAPIGKGQRGLIVSPPKAGKTTIIKQIVRAIEHNNPEVYLMVLLIDERPEEVTDMVEHVQDAEVVASVFDRPAAEHVQVAELAIERAKRLVEMGFDVVVVLDGITRLARAYNLAAPTTGKTLSGGIDSAALYPAKRFFGAARNVREGGSLTILATALVETGSKMDEVIFEEFKGTGNMELRLNRDLAERRIFPAIDAEPSSTRRDDLIIASAHLQQVWKVRRILGSLDRESGLRLLKQKMGATGSNDEFLDKLAR